MLVNATQNGFSAVGNPLLLDALNMLSILGVTSEVVFLLPSAVYIGCETALAIRPREWGKWGKLAFSH